MFKGFNGSMLAAAFVAIAATVSIYAQEDLAGGDGLPRRIGGATCNSAPPGGVGTISGFLNVRGSVSSGKEPAFSVVVYARGAMITRKRVKNGGAYAFYCVPRDGVRIAVEVDSSEISSVSIGQLAQAPFNNRQDMDIQWSEASPQPQQKAAVVPVQNLYQRTDEHQRLFNKALDKLTESNGSVSIGLLDQIVKADPADFAAWAFLGNIHFNLGRFDEAEKNYDKSLAANKDYLPAMLGIGRSALNQKKFARAIEVLSAAFAAVPTSADINHYLGEAYLQDRKGSLAIVHLNRAIDIAPFEKAELHLRLGALYNAAGAKDLAAKQYALYLQKRPTSPDKEKIEQYISQNSK